MTPFKTASHAEELPLNVNVCIGKNNNAGDISTLLLTGVYGLHMHEEQKCVDNVMWIYLECVCSLYLFDFNKARMACLDPRQNRAQSI